MIKIVFYIWIKDKMNNHQFYWRRNKRPYVFTQKYLLFLFYLCQFSDASSINHSLDILTWYMWIYWFLDSDERRRKKKGILRFIIIFNDNNKSLWTKTSWKSILNMSMWNQCDRRKKIERLWRFKTCCLISLDLS